MALELDYVHILGLHEFTGLDINPRVGPLLNLQRGQAVPGFPNDRILNPLFAAHAAELLAEFGDTRPFARITVAQSDGRSRYDAFTASFKKRYANKYQLNMHYTLSKSQAWFGATQDFGLQPQNLFDKWDPINFGPTGEDERHRFVLSGIFDLPYGFQVAPIFQLASARPYSIFPSCVCDINVDGVNNDRDSVDPTVNDQVKLPINSERGDKFSQLNVRVSKFFRWGEHKKLGLFFEAFNVLTLVTSGTNSKMSPAQVTSASLLTSSVPPASLSQLAFRSKLSLESGLASSPLTFKSALREAMKLFREVPFPFNSVYSSISID